MKSTAFYFQAKFCREIYAIYLNQRAAKVYECKGLRNYECLLHMSILSWNNNGLISIIAHITETDLIHRSQ